MKKLFMLIVLASLLISAGISYSAQQWIKTYGGPALEGAYSIQLTTDGGYIAAGNVASLDTGENDFWVLKLDSNGDITWQKTYGGSDNDYATAIQQTVDGGYIVAGTTSSFGAGESDPWLLKLDSNGDITWQKTYGGTRFDYATAVQQTVDGGYIVAGNTSSFGAGEIDLWLLKLDGSGEIIWQKAYGGSGFDWAFSMQQTTDGGYIIVGDTFSFGAGENDLWVLKLDNSGAVSWQKTYGGSGFDWAFSVQQTSDGGYIVVADTFSFGAGEVDIWILKLDSNGDITWQKTYGSSDFDWPASVEQTIDGGYIVAGGTYSFGAGKDDLWVLKLDSNGDITWQKTYGGSDNDYAASIRQTANGGYVVAGTTSSFGAGEDDLWVLMLDSNGEIPGSDVIGSSNAAAFNTSVVAQDSNCLVESTSASVGFGNGNSFIYLPVILKE